MSTRPSRFVDRMPFASLARRIVWALEAPLNWLATRSPTAARLNYRYRWWRTDLKQRDHGPVVFVYQVGKVGSTAVKKSLEDHGCRAFHVHFMSRKAVEANLAARRPLFGTERERSLKRTWRYEYLSDRIRRWKGKRRFSVVTLVRDPVAWMLSRFFHSAEVIGETADSCTLAFRDLGSQITLTGTDLRPLLDLFLTADVVYCDRPGPVADISNLRGFLDDEIQGVLGIDLFATPFATEVGYSIHRTAICDLLTLRLEDLDRCAAAAFREFLQLDGFELRRDNVREERDVGPIYRRFLDSIRLSDRFLDEVYDSDYARHFYSPEECATFRRRWASAAR